MDFATLLSCMTYSALCYEYFPFRLPYIAHFQSVANVYQVLHNIAIAEYFRDGCSDPRKLLEVLNNVKVWFF